MSVLSFTIPLQGDLLPLRVELHFDDEGAPTGLALGLSPKGEPAPCWNCRSQFLPWEAMESLRHALTLFCAVIRNGDAALTDFSAVLDEVEV